MYSRFSTGLEVLRNAWRKCRMKIQKKSASEWQIFLATGVGLIDTFK
jgi:hypothetical protein